MKDWNGLWSGGFALLAVWFGSWLTGFNDKRRDERENQRGIEHRQDQREERRKERRERREENQHENQKRILMELQDALEPLYAATWKVITKRKEQLFIPVVPHTLGLLLGTEFHNAASTVNRLSYRISDANLRKDVHEFYHFAYFVRDAPIEIREGVAITPEVYLAEQTQEYKTRTFKMNESLGERLVAELGYT